MAKAKYSSNKSIAKVFRVSERNIECPHCRENSTYQLAEIHHRFWNCRTCGKNFDLDIMLGGE